MGLVLCHSAQSSGTWQVILQVRRRNPWRHRTRTDSQTHPLIPKLNLIQNRLKNIEDIISLERQ